MNDNSQDIQQMLIDKRNKMGMQIRKEQREELFKMKRMLSLLSLTSQIEQDLPLFNDNFLYHYPQYVQQISETVKRTISVQPNLQFQFSPSDSQESYIENIILLYKSLQDIQIDPSYPSAYPIEIIFKVLNKGLPKIDKICLDLLIQFSLPEKSTQMPIFEKGYVQNILETINQTTFIDIQNKCLILLRNLAADSSKFRDHILHFDTIQSAFQIFLRQAYPIEVVCEYFSLLINIMFITPQIPKLKMLLIVEPIYYLLQNYNQQLNLYDSSILKQVLQMLRIALQQNEQRKELYSIEFTYILVKLLPNVDNEIVREISHILQLFSFDSKNQFPEQLQVDITKALVQSLKDISSNGLNLYDKDKRNLAKKCFNALMRSLNNYALDGKNILELIISDQSFMNLLININVKQDTFVQLTLLSFYKVILVSCSDAYLELTINPQGPQNIFKQVMQILENEEAGGEILIEGLLVLRCFFTRFQQLESNKAMVTEIIKVDKLRIYKLFEEEGGLQSLYKLSQHRLQEVYEQVEIIYSFLDI